MSFFRRGSSATTSWRLLVASLVWNHGIAARTKLRSSVRDQHQVESQNESEAQNECGGLMPGGTLVERTYTGISAACSACLSQKPLKCKWCPLNLYCQKEGDACLARSAKTTADKISYKWGDAKIKGQAKHCPQRTGDDRTPYLKIMKENYGADWDRPERETELADARRCLQWSLDWPVEEDPNMPLRDPDPMDKKDNGITVDDVGLWACKSAMLREAFVGLIHKGFEGLDVKWRQSSGRSINQGDVSRSSSSQSLSTSADFTFLSPDDNIMDDEVSSVVSPQYSPEGDEEESEARPMMVPRETALLETQSRTSGGPDWKVQQVRPRLCDFVNLKLGSRKACEVHAYGADDFEQLRKAFAQPNGEGDEDAVTYELLEELMAGPIVTFNPGGGKSGSGFSRTWNNKYKIKLELRRGSLYDRFINEPQNLLFLVKGRPGFRPGSVSLEEHFRAHPDSMLNRYYGLVKIVIDGSGSYCLLMQDAMYNLMDKASAWSAPSAPWASHFKLYDLKGPSRDQEKASPGKTGYNLEFRQEQPEGVLVLSDEQCQVVRKSFDADSLYLKAHQLIDYSIMILIADLTDDAKPGAWCAGTPGQPHCEEAVYPCDNEIGTCRKGYTFSVIDFLNDKNFVKTYETLNGHYKFNHYGQGIRSYMASICRTRKEKELFMIFAAAVRTASSDLMQSVEESWGDIAEGEEEIGKEVFVKNLEELGVPTILETSEGSIDMNRVFAELVEQDKETISKAEFMHAFAF